MMAPYARILLRYLALPLALWLGMPEGEARGLISDPDVVTAVAGFLALIFGIVEGWYVWAKRQGKAT